MSFKTAIIAIICVVSFGDAGAQMLIYRNLSKQFDFKITAKKYKADGNVFDNAKLTIDIFKKNQKSSIQTINLIAEFLFEDAYKTSKKARSYVTGFNIDALVSDYDYGDMILADLNFDGREDIAIKQSSGGNAGAIYSFYTQDKFGKFKQDLFLTDKVSYFPADIDKFSKTLSVNATAGTTGIGVTTFKYDSKRKQWKKIKHVVYIKG